MKRWLKYGLWFGVIDVLLLLLYFVDSLSPTGLLPHFVMRVFEFSQIVGIFFTVMLGFGFPNLLTHIFNLLTWFLVGAIIGKIVDKVKGNKLNNITRGRK